MTNLTLERIKQDESYTLGILSIDGYECFTLELPWKDNQQNISCIPKGAYSWKKRHSPSKDCEVIELVDVPNRSYIQIHVGNYTSQILGCILPGLGVKDINNDGVFDVTNSSDAFNKIMSISGETGEIEII